MYAPSGQEWADDYGGVIADKVGLRLAYLRRGSREMRFAPVYVAQRRGPKGWFVICEGRAKLDLWECVQPYMEDAWFRAMRALPSEAASVSEGALDGARAALGDLPPMAPARGRRRGS